MNAREIGIRRIRLVTRGLAVVGVAGSVAFAGLAKAATDSDRAATPRPAPASTSGRTTPTPAATKGGTVKAPATRATQPSVNDTVDEPQITVGGS
jgi:hypothetical protein